MQARELMSSHVIVVPPETPVIAVVELLAARGVSAAPVVDADGAPVGIVTEGDLIRRLAEQPPGPLDWFLKLFREARPMMANYAKAHGTVARDVMSTKLVTVTEDETAEHIAQLMEKHHIRRVLVLRDGKLAGVVSRADLLRALLRAPPTIADRDDRAILRAVGTALRAQPWVDTLWVSPDVKEGVVTLYGYARSDDMRQALVVLARDIPGVTEVKDRMDPMPLLLRASL
jgi:CBS domain-containing protein